MAKQVEEGELNDKQKLFCKEYLIDLNGTKAAERAGYSVKTAPEQGSRLLNNVKVCEFLKELMDKRANDAGVTAKDVLDELIKVGFSDIGDFFNDGYSIKPLSELKDNSRSIQSIQVDDTEGEFGHSRTVKFKLYDKLSALEKIAKHLGMFEKDNAQKSIMIAPVIMTKK